MTPAARSNMWASTETTHDRMHNGQRKNCTIKHRLGACLHETHPSVLNRKYQPANLLYL